MLLENIKNKRVIVRCDFNESIIDGELESTKRIDANINTIHELLSRNNVLILMSHHSDTNQNMLPVYNYLKKVFTDKINYINSVNMGVVSDYIMQHKNNSEIKIFLIENTRMFLGERGEQLDENNDTEFAKKLAGLGECFVFDAFSVGHRDHASVTGIAKILPSCFGNTFLNEYKNLSKILKEKENTLLISGGAKLSTKIPIIKNFLENGASVMLGGAMIHPIIKSKGFDIKDSLTEESVGANIIDYIKDNKNIILPDDYAWGGDKILDNLYDEEIIKDIMIKRNIKNILWNGPVGVYEKGFKGGTENVFKFIKKQENVYKIVGGGDTITFLTKTDVNFEENFSYVSLSGGAMLEFLATETLVIMSHISLKNVI